MHASDTGQVQNSFVVVFLCQTEVTKVTTTCNFKIRLKIAISYLGIKTLSLVDTRYAHLYATWFQTSSCEKSGKFIYVCFHLDCSDSILAVHNLIMM